MNTKHSIKVGTNLYLWLLTGRSRGFYNRALNTGVNYNISKTPSVIVEAREVLRLGYEGTDFYVINALMSLYNAPELLKGLPHEVPTLLAPGALRIPPSSCSAELVPSDSQGTPYIDGSVAGKNNFDAVKVSFKNAEEVTLTYDGAVQNSISARYTKVQDDAGIRLHIEDADTRIGLHADLLTPSWDLGDHITLSIAPTGYQFAAVVKSIGDNARMLDLMLEEGTMEVFAVAKNSIDKLSAFVCAIVRRMWKHVNDKQHGFTVTISVDDDLNKLITVEPHWKNHDGI